VKLQLHCWEIENKKLKLINPIAHHHIYEPKYICDQNMVKFPSLVCEIWCSQRVRVIACCDLDLWIFNPKI